LKFAAPRASLTSSTTPQATTPNDTIALVFDELFHTFAPAQVQLAIHEIPSGRFHVWESNMAGAGRRGKLLWRDLDFSQREDSVFQDGQHHLFGILRAGS